MPPVPTVAPPPPEGPADRLRIALDLHDAGVDMMRQRLRRLHPGATGAELEHALRSWLLDKPLPCDPLWTRVRTGDART